MKSARSVGDDLVRGLLRGRSGLAAGFSFVPEAAIAGMMWGHPGTPRLAAACCELGLDFAFVASGEPGARALAEAVASCGASVFWTVEGPFGRVSAERGWSRTLADTARLTLDLTDALDRATLDAATEIAAAPPAAVACVIAEDIAASYGPLLAPDYVFAELIPRLGRLVAAATNRGMDPVLHSDGDTRVVIDALVDAGFLGLHVGGVSYDEFEMIYQSARAAGLSVIGGLSGDDLRAGVPRAMKAGVTAGMLAMSRGLLVADDGGLTTSEEVAALVAAIGTARGSEPEEGRL